MVWTASFLGPLGIGTLFSILTFPLLKVSKFKTSLYMQLYTGIGKVSGSLYYVYDTMKHILTYSIPMVRHPSVVVVVHTFRIEYL